MIYFVMKKEEFGAIFTTTLLSTIVDDRVGTGMKQWTHRTVEKG